METEGSLPHSKRPADCPNPEHPFRKGEDF